VSASKRTRSAAPDGTLNSHRREQLLELWERSQHEPVAAEAIYGTLREAILRGILPAGERLTEVPLAKLFRRSRTPVREGILRLEAERLTERSSRGGFVVGAISREEVLEVYTVREVLDGVAARLAAQAILPADLDHLRWLNGRMREAADRGDFEPMIGLNIEFHEAVCRAGRNSLLLQMMRQIHDWVRRFPESTFAYPGRAKETVLEHEALLEAIERRDAEAAERIAREHMTTGMKVRIAMLQNSRQSRPLDRVPMHRQSGRSG
jgi:DNA-binding GntR family transcriptional regulator